MKRMKAGVLGIIAVSGLMTFAPLAQAKDNQVEKPEAKEGRAEARRDRMKQIAEELKLTAEQKEKLKPIFKEEAEKLRELRGDDKLTRVEKMAKVKEIREAGFTKIKTVLTPEQTEKFQKIREEARKNFQKP